jgi:1-acyl-sn-glycerol-3-phosphate acyltransferase
MFQPEFLGLENIPTDRPLLFVSNHPIMAFDFPLMLEGLYARTGIFLRTLADHSHFQIPINGYLLRTMLGVVDGNRRNTELLFSHGQCIFVYPGGARETFKKTTDEKYALFWGERLGFAEMAVRNGATIVPVSSLGTEDMLDIVYDMPLGWLPIPFL